MRAFPTDLKTGLAANAQNVGWLLSVTPTGLDPVYLTTTGGDFLDSSVSPAATYLGDPGFVFDGAHFKDGSDPGAMQVKLPCSEDGPITPDNVTRGMYTGAAVVLRVLKYVGGNLSPAIGFKWVVGSTLITDDGKAEFNILAATRVNRELVLKTVGVPCPYNLGDSRCGKDLTAFTDTVEVASVESLHEIIVTGTARANGFFDNGGFRFSNGPLAGRAFTVRKYTLATGQILFWERLPMLPVVGNDATVHAGCDKSIGAAGCTKFSNIARYGGFAHLPADDAKFAYDGGASDPVVTDPTPRRYNWSTGLYE